jgi:hypothetical protein
MSPDPAWRAMIDWFGWYVVLPATMLFIVVGMIALTVFVVVSVVDIVKSRRGRARWTKR